MTAITGKLTGKKSEHVKRAIDKLHELEEKNNMLIPQDVVEEARDENSPLHSYFEWDNRIGGEKYRLMQARVLITRVTVESLGEPKDQYFNVVVKNQRGYVSRDVVLSDEDMQRQVKNYALHQLRHWQETYNELNQELGIVNEEKLEAELESTL